MSELINELVAAEGILGTSSVEANVGEASTSQPKSKGKGKKFNEMAKCYILASISNVLQYQMQDVKLSSDIMHSLKEMFSEQGLSARQKTMREIYNTEMAEGTSIRE